MIELLDPKNIDQIAYNEGRLKRIRAFSLLKDKRIGWNYCMDYVWLSMRLENGITRKMKIVDIGCGPGAIHGYLENKYKTKIIGVDINRWNKDYVDFQGDYTDQKFRKKIGINNNSLDLIISTSAFEHNTPKEHKRLVEVCLKTLKKGGRLVTTFAATKKTYYFNASHQWNLSKADIEKIYKDNFDTYDFDEIRKRWINHTEIPSAFRKRFGFKVLRFPNFLSVGADIRKK
jgi:SAM-dependent methyltransferase